MGKIIMSMVIQKMSIETSFKLELVVAYDNEITEEVAKWSEWCWDFYHKTGKICIFPAVFAKSRRTKFLR